MPEPGGTKPVYDALANADKIELIATSTMTRSLPMKLAVLALCLLVAAPAAAQTPPLAIRTTTPPLLGAGGLMLVTLESKTVIAVAPTDLRAGGLEVAQLEATCISAARITLASGAAVIVPMRDIVDAARLPARPATCPPPGREVFNVPVASRTDASLPSDAQAMTQIRAECAKLFPDNFMMRNSCEQQELKALEEL